MGKNTQSASSDPDAVAAAVDVRHEHLRNQVEDVCDTIAILENQQASFQKSLDQLSDSNTAFQTTMTSQFASFQTVLLEELRHLKSALPPTPTTTVLPTSTPATSVHPNPTLNPRASTSNLQPSFHSLFPAPSSSPMGLGLSNPPNLNPLPTYTPSTRPTPSHITITPRSAHSQPNPASSSHYSPHPYTHTHPTPYTSHSFHISPSPTPHSTHHTHPTPYTSQHPSNIFKPIKMELPRFIGEDPYGWLAMAERYLDYYEVPPQQWVLVAACNFGADASIWMKGFEQRHGRDNWGLFVDLLLQRFGGGDRANIESQLTHIQQIGTVDDYIAEFTKLSCRVIDWTENQLKHVFLGGLKEDI
ncbi:hypothetical protein ACFX2A_011768 [Malus domestica]